MPEVQLSTIEEALEDFKAGKFVIVVDDEDRENEGDLITAAELITPEKINYMLQLGRGAVANWSWSTKSRPIRRCSERPSP